MLKGEEKEELDPKLIIVLGAISFVVVFGAVVVLGFGVELGLAFGLVVFMMAMILIFLPNIQKGKKPMKPQRTPICIEANGNRVKRRNRTP